MKQWCTNYKFSQNEFASRYSTQSYIYTWHVFFAHLSFQTHDPTQPTKNTDFRPIPDPTQPNPRVNPTHGQLCIWSCIAFGVLTSFVRNSATDRFANFYKFTIEDDSQQTAGHVYLQQLHIDDLLSRAYDSNSIVTNVGHHKFKMLG